MDRTLVRTEPASTTVEMLAIAMLCAALLVMTFLTYARLRASTEERRVSGGSAGVSSVGRSVDDTRLAAIAAMLNDGNAHRGRFYRTADGHRLFVIEP